MHEITTPIAADQRTSCGRVRPNAMMTSAAAKGAHVMIESTGRPLT